MREEQANVVLVIGGMLVSLGLEFDLIDLGRLDVRGRVVVSGLSSQDRVVAVLRCCFLCSDRFLEKDCGLEWVPSLRLLLWVICNVLGEIQQWYPFLSGKKTVDQPPKDAKTSLSGF